MGRLDHEYLNMTLRSTPSEHCFLHHCAQDESQGCLHFQFNLYPSQVFAMSVGRELKQVHLHAWSRDWHSIMYAIHGASGRSSDVPPANFVPLGRSLTLSRACIS